MKNRNHVLLAIIVGSVIYSILKIDDFGFFVLLIIGSVLPDVLEPATNYNHRGYFHSKRVLKKMPILILIGFILGLLTNNYHLFFGLIGYSIHLVGDATTPMGLPY